MCLFNKTLVASSAFSCFLLLGCATPPSSEQDVVKSLPTDPNANYQPVDIEQQLEEPSMNDPRYTPVRTNMSMPHRVPNGSLFDPNQYTGIFVSKRVYQIGDMLQIQLEEETKASKQQALQSDKKSELELGSLELRAGRLSLNDDDVGLNHQQNSSFNSNSSTTQSNTLEGVVNVFVREVLNNGNLKVAGEKWVKLNEGEEYIRVSGELRTIDILPDNAISSTKLGNARIEYSGAGRMKDNQKETLIGSLLSIFN
ncbi:flagellar basal body L-ring protein FlgH [Alteromonas gracilis]|uniref:flagellar basal body L-ring protein FlgH n=1 Tax=Alteromonas gracilis TaxID=1479524 RepID=UPI0030D08EE9